MRGAGGTEGGLTQFLVGLAMFVGGAYLFLTSVQVSSGFHWGYSYASFGGFQLTSGMVLIPFVFGVVWIFYDANQLMGWILAAGSLLALSFGILRSLNFTFPAMSLFDLLTILVLICGGVGIFLSSLKDKTPRRSV